MSNYFQPNFYQGSFQPGRETPFCPQHPNVLCVLVGTRDYRFRCPVDGQQYNDAGAPMLANTIQSAPLVTPPNSPGDANFVDYSKIDFP